MRERTQASYFRKPLNINLYHILLVYSHGMWMIDSHSWSESVVHQAQREEKRINPTNRTKIITSPSDDDAVITKIVREMNRFAR